MDVINLKTKVVDAINAITEGTVDPALTVDEFIYLLDISDMEQKTLIITKFTKVSKKAVETRYVRYGNQHVMHQVLFGQLPSSTVPPITKRLPKKLAKESPLPDPTIILGFY